MDHIDGNTNIEEPDELPPPDSDPKDSPTGTPTGSRITMIVFGFALLVPLLMFVRVLPEYVHRLEEALRFPYEIDAEEGFVFNDAIRLFRGQAIYEPINEAPWLVGNYPPLFPWIVSKTLSPERLTLPVGRLVSFFGALMLVQILGGIIFARTRRIFVALLSPMLLILSYEFYGWFIMCRVDFFALGLTALGLYSFISGRSRWSLPISALIFVAAGFTRQTAILAPLACCISLLLFDRRGLVMFLGTYAITGLVGFFALNIATEGEFFRHTVLYNVNEAHWGQFRAVMKNEIWYFYRWWICALVLGLIHAAGIAWLRRNPSIDSPAVSVDGDAPADNDAHFESLPFRRYRIVPRSRGVVGIYMLLASLSLLSFAKIGSAPNYALEFLFALALLTGDRLGRFLDEAEFGRPDMRKWAMVGAVILTVGIIGHTARLTRPKGLRQHLLSSATPNPQDVTDAHRLMDRLQQVQTIMTEFPSLSITLDRPVDYEPFIMSRLEAEGLWDATPVYDRIAAQEYGLIVTSQDLRGIHQGQVMARFSTEMTREILSWYELEQDVGFETPNGLRRIYFVWRPRNLEQRRESVLEAARLFSAETSPIAPEQGEGPLT